MTQAAPRALATETLTSAELVLSEHMPLVGTLHPLRKVFERTLYWGSIIACGVHVVVLVGWMIMESRKKDVPVDSVVRILNIADLGVPPSLSQAQAPQVNLAQQVTPPSIGVPEPVPDYQATTQTIATQQEMSDFQTMDMSAFGDGSGDSLVVNLEGDAAPSPDDFVAVEEMPVLIQLPAPVYPEMARAAEVEGKVTIRVLVGKDGKVQDAIVTDGHPMLNDAAIAAAKKATFKPALQQHKPVAVWVQIPMVFNLN